MPDPLCSILAELAAITDAGLRRRMRQVDGPQRAEVVVDGRNAINFSSNNYLGLAADPLLIEAARANLAESGFGAGGSRLIVGNLPAHRALEARLANWKSTEAALLFNSGYQANIGLVSTLAGPEDVVFSDALNHASLIDGCRLSRARTEVFGHRDTADLVARLRASGHARRRIILTDSVFSMDGDRAPLSTLVEIARAHDALLVVDEAHAIGVLGEGGVGLASAAGVPIQMGTLGKALGGFGAYVAGPRPIIDLLINRARSFVFTTALPTSVVAAAHAAIDWLTTDEGTRRRGRLAEVALRFHGGLRALGLPVPEEPSHIVPLRVKGGDPLETMSLSDALLERGVFVQGIRPPTVPPGTSRLRFALMATHSDAQVDHALAALAALRTHLT